MHADVVEGHLRLLDGGEDADAAGDYVVDAAGMRDDQVREGGHLRQAPQHMRRLAPDVWVADVVSRAENEDDRIEQEVGIYMCEDLRWWLARRDGPLVELEDLYEVLEDARRQDGPLGRDLRRRDHHGLEWGAGQVIRASTFHQVRIGGAQEDRQHEREEAPEQRQELRATQHDVVGEPFGEELLELRHVALVLEVARALYEALGLLERGQQERVEPLESRPEDLLLEGRGRRKGGDCLRLPEGGLDALLVHEALLLGEAPKERLHVRAAEEEGVEA
mmetsp:Transcript_100109/g.298780  ORF Transcript_100109/g.298780 Transcript_100109/m.298780 type:complete len:277 (+) Transcript_100109:1086-1916(+)